MAAEVGSAIKSAIAAFTKYVEDVATMTVETKMIDASSENTANLDQARPVARTILRMDGDSETIIPVRRNENGGQEVEADLLEIHMRNVATAIDYRARILNALASTLLPK